MKPTQNLPGTSLPGFRCSGFRNRPQIAIAVFFLIICATAAIDSAASSSNQLGTVLTGKFVAQVDGPRVTGFGSNRQAYIFEMDSAGGSQFVTLYYNFFIYQPQLQRQALDYSKPYKLTAVRDDKCDDTLENISRRFVFDSHGHFVEARFALSYATNLPSLTLPWKNPLPCYVLSPVPPGAKVATEANPAVQ